MNEKNKPRPTLHFFTGNPDCNPNTWSSYDGDCCSVDYPCAVGEGDCDTDAQCVGDLKCGSNNCGALFPNPDVDCCGSFCLSIGF